MTKLGRPDAMTHHTDDTIVQEISVTDTGAGPYGITTGSDRALWLTLAHSGAAASTNNATASAPSLGNAQ